LQLYSETLLNLIKIILLFKKKEKRKKAFDVKNMFSTFGSCFEFSKTIKGKNDPLNCALDDVRVGAQLCLLVTPLHLANPKPLMLAELNHQVI